MRTDSFRGKTVIITGASAGVGAACARAFAAQRAKLVLIARGEAALDAISKELRAQTEVLAISMDVSDTGSCLKLLERTEQVFGAIHCLINNAGAHLRGNVETRSPEDLAAMVDVNLRAPLVLTAAVLPYLRKAGGGAIAMVGSLAGCAPLQGAATYSATKAGLRAFTYALADELRGSNIRVGVVCPGPIDTGFIMTNLDDVEDIVFSQPMSSAEQVADAILRLVSGERTEIAIPASSGMLLKLFYLFPWLRRKLRPLFDEKGRKNKQKYRNRPGR